MNYYEDCDLPVNYNEMEWPDRRIVRERYIEAQDGTCMYCLKPLDGPPAKHVTDKKVNWDLFPGGEGFLDYPIHLHHCHATGMTEGAVHAYCNAVLWQYEGR